MHVARVVVGPLRTNCYVLHDMAAGRALVVDPGDDAAAVLALLDRLGSPQVAAIVLTHCHWDHVQAVDAVRDACDAPVAAHAEEHQVWSHELDHLRCHGHWDWALAAAERPASSEPIAPGWNGTVDMPLEQLGLDVLHTPGHSPGSISLVSRPDRFVLTGDTTIGRERPCLEEWRARGW